MDPQKFNRLVDGPTIDLSLNLLDASIGQRVAIDGSFAEKLARLAALLVFLSERWVQKE